jgi:MarR family 2-MHQ and catechol resistance regulon transcriptional repressor
MVQLTEAGRDLIAELFPAHAAAVAEEMSVLSLEEQRQLGELCRKLGKGLEQRQAAQSLQAA